MLVLSPIEDLHDALIFSKSVRFKGFLTVNLWHGLVVDQFKKVTKLLDDTLLDQALLKLMVMLNAQHLCIF